MAGALCSSRQANYQTCSQKHSLLSPPEVWVPQRLACTEPLIRVVCQQLADQVSTVWRHMRQHLSQAAALTGWEVKGGAVGGAFLQLGQEVSWGCANDGVDLLDLV